jgi:hypothetical protein
MDDGRAIAGRGWEMTARKRASRPKSIADASAGVDLNQAVGWSGERRLAGYGATTVRMADQWPHACDLYDLFLRRLLQDGKITTGQVLPEDS